MTTAQWQGQHSTNRGSQSSSWEDDAWKIDSDDDEFVKASQAAGPSSAISKLTRLGHEGASQGPSVAKRHAPPARPHPNFAHDPFPQLGTSHDAETKLPTAVPATTAARPATRSTESVSETDLRRSKDEEHSAQPIDHVQIKQHSRETQRREMKEAIRDNLSDILTGKYGSLPVEQTDRPPVDPTELLGNMSLASDRPRVSRNTSETFSATAIPAGVPETENPNIDPTNAVVAVDGVMTNLPASAENFNLSTLAKANPDAPLLHDMSRKSSVRSKRRKEGFIKCLSSDVVPMDDLRALAWAGVPDDVRPMVWMLLLGYLPPTKSVRAATLARKRAEYRSGVRLAFQRGTEALDQAIWHQIHIDVPRTNPGISLWQREATQRVSEEEETLVVPNVKVVQALERILYVWAIRHPASGYVQGINDLATPFFEVFLSAYITSDPEQYDVALLPAEALEALEADTFWCLSKLLDGIQDNYIFAQPGIQRQVRRMGELVSRINRE